MAPALSPLRGGIRSMPTATGKHLLTATLLNALCTLLAAAGLHGQSPSAAPAAAQALVNRYCRNCHNEDLKPGGVSLDGVRATGVGANADTWEKVFRKVRTGEMPPLGKIGRASCREREESTGDGEE